MTECPALVLVCKRPRLGHGKQRLALHLGLEVTQLIAEALLACALEDAFNWPGQVVIAPANRHDYDWAVILSKSIQSPVMVIPQGSGNLGKRLNNLDQTLRCQGINQLVYIGSDAPGLNETDYSTVLKALQQYDTVLIPANDGGVVLMASKSPWPDLCGLPWSTDQLGRTLVNVCHMAGHSVKNLEQGYDVDELGDVMLLNEMLANDHRSARRDLHKLVCHLPFVKEKANV